jgi:hypothetical protein
MKIAFGYKAGSGKSTAVEYLIKKYGGVEKSFAAPLYDILHYAQNTCHFPIEKDRKFLQYVGTEWARTKDDRIWIKLLLESISKENGNIFISDLRFKNEFDVLKNKGFTMVLLQRDKIDIHSQDHSSENDLNDEKKWDFIIQNNSTLVHFYEELDKIIFKILKRESI